MPRESSPPSPSGQRIILTNEQWEMHKSKRQAGEGSPSVYPHVVSTFLGPLTLMYPFASHDFHHINPQKITSGGGKCWRQPLFEIENWEAGQVRNRALRGKEQGMAVTFQVNK